MEKTYTVTVKWNGFDWIDTFWMTSPSGKTLEVVPQRIGYAKISNSRLIEVLDKIRWDENDNERTWLKEYKIQVTKQDMEDFLDLSKMKSCEDFDRYMKNEILRAKMADHLGYAKTTANRKAIK